MLAAMVAFAPATARANPEASPYDSRSIAVGLTGVAWLERPAALALNPANLQGVDNFTLGLSGTVIFANQFAPVEGPDSQLNAPGIGPVGALFGAGRIHERVVIGLGVYLDAGYGATFENVQNVDGHCNRDDPPPSCSEDPRPAEDLSVVFFQGEAALGASVRVLEDARWGLLDIGLALRVPFASQQSDTYQENPLTGRYGNTQQDVFGIGLPGVRVGITYRPTDDLAFAVSYRSKTRTTMSGEVESGGLTLDAESDWYSPHMLHLGGAFWFLDHDLMLATEYRVQFHEEANEEQVIDLSSSNPSTQALLEATNSERITAPFLWQNVHSFRLGLEGWLFDKSFALRGGYNIARSATTEEGAQYFTPPHGWSSALYAGVGLELGEFAIDLASAFTWASNTVEESGEFCQPGQPAKAGCAGDYETRTWWLSATVTYQL